jgi:hypothetical protein
MTHRLRRIVLVAAAVATAAAARAQEIPTYLACTVDLFPADIVALTSADLDRNGSPDIAAIDADSETVIVLLTDAATFAVGACEDGVTQPLRPSTGSGAADLDVRDLDGNGTPDIVVAERRGARVLAGDGQGNFTAQAPIDVGAAPVTVVAGDFDGDGVSDIAVGTGADRNIAVLYGIADGGFVEPPLVVAMEGSVDDLAAADLNRDGRLDLVGLSADAGRARVALGRSDAARAFRLLAAFDVGAGSNALGVEDFNLDGTPDLAVSAEIDEEEGLLTVFFGSLSGNDVDYTSREPLEADTLGNSVALAVGRFTGDAFPDAVVTHEDTDTVELLAGDGGDDFTAAEACTDACAAPRAVTSAKLDGDALPDLVVANGIGSITFLLSTNAPPTPTFTATGSVTPTPSPSPSPSPTDTPPPTPTPTGTPTRTGTITRTPTITETATPGPFSIQGEGCGTIAGGGARGFPAGVLVVGAVFALMRRRVRTPLAHPSTSLRVSGKRPCGDRSC